MLMSGELKDPTNIVECERLKRISEATQGKGRSEVLAQTGGLQHHVSLPLEIQGKTLGLMNLARKGTAPLSEEERETLTLAGSMVASAIRRTQLHDLAEASQLEERQALQNLSAALLGLLDQAEIAQATLRETVTHVSADGFALLVVDQTDRYLEAIASRGWMAETEHRIPLEPPDSSGPALCASRREVVRENHAHPDLPFKHRHVPREKGVKTCVHVPILSRDRVLGVLMANRLTEVPFTEEEARFLTLAANQAGAALERAGAVESLRLAETRHRALFENVPVGLYRSTRDGRILDVNPAFVEMLAYPDRETALKAGAVDLYTSPEDRERFQALLDRDGIARDFMVQLRRYDGEMIWVSVNTRAARAEDGEVTYEGSLQDVTERRRAESALHDRERFLAALNDMTRAALESWEYEDTLQKLADDLTDMFGADGCYLNIWEEGREKIASRIVARQTRGAQATLAATPDEPTITRSALALGRPLVVEDMRDTPYLSPRLAALYPHRSALGLPLISGLNKLGAAVVVFDEARRFTPEELARGEQAARQIALALSRMRLQAEIQRNAYELTAVLRITDAVIKTRDLNQQLDVILREISVFLQAEYAGIFLVEAGIPTLRHSRGLSLALREQVAALDPAVLRQRGIVRGPVGPEAMPHFARLEGIQSGAITPLFLPERPGEGAEWLGTMVVASRDPDVLTETRMRAVSRMTQTIALAIDHARAYQQASDRLGRLQTLHDVDLAILSSSDLRLTMRVVLEAVVTHLKVDAAALLRLNPRTQLLEYSARHGFRSTALQGTRVRLGEGLAGRAASTREILNADDMAGESPITGRLVGEDFVSRLAAPLVAKGHLQGVLELFHRTPLKPDPEWLAFLEGLAAQAALAVDAASLFDQLQRANIELTLSYDNTLEGWVRALDLRDKETEGHTQRVTELTGRLAEAMGIPLEDLEHIRRGALLHDIGKIGVPDRILLKPGPLTEEEREVMYRHPDYAHDMLAPIPFLKQLSTFPTVTTRSGTALDTRAACEANRSPWRRGSSPSWTSGMRSARIAPTGTAGRNARSWSTSTSRRGRISIRESWKRSCG